MEQKMTRGKAELSKANREPVIAGTLSLQKVLDTNFQNKNCIFILKIHSN
jgi:hypothetical protein